MNPEERRMLEEIAVVCNENNTILRSLQRARRWGVAVRVFYWVLIIGTSFGAYFALQPYLDMLGGAYTSVEGNIKQVGEIGNTLRNFGQ